MASDIASNERARLLALLEQAEMLSIAMQVASGNTQGLDATRFNAYVDVVNYIGDELALFAAEPDASARLLALIAQLPRYAVSEIDDMMLPNPVPDGNWIRYPDLQAALAALLPPVGQPLEPAKPGHVCGLQGYCPGYPHFDPPCPACVARYRS
jgi:hypothetical protein